MNWFRLIPYVLTIMLTAGACWTVHGWLVDRLETRHAADLLTQKLAVTAQCRAAQKVTMEVSHELQGRFSDLNRRYAAARLRQSDCTVVYSPGTPAGHDAAPRDQGLLRPNGITAGQLREYARDAEAVGLQLDACQAFAQQAWQGAD